MEKKPAFTLIEILIVIGIIGILVAALLPVLTTGPERSRDAARRKALTDLASAMHAYSIDNSSYPAPQVDGCLDPTDQVPGLPAGTTYSDVLRTYSAGTPVPREPGQPTAQSCGGTGSYYYKSFGGGFVLAARLEVDGVGNSNATQAQLTADPFGAAQFAAIENSVGQPAPPPTNFYVVARRR